MVGGEHGSGRAANAVSGLAAIMPPSSRLTAALLVFATLAAVGSLPQHARAAAPGKATSDAAARHQAIRAIPWRNLSPTDRRDVQHVVQNTSIYRRLPTRVVECDPDLFTFLLQHPDVVVDVWRLMGISRVALERISPAGFRGTDGNGTSGQVRYVAANWGAEARNLAVVYADGAYEGNPFPVPLRAQSVLVLRSAAKRDAQGRHQVTVQIDSFVHLEQVGVELVAKTVQPWISRIADQNFIETVEFVGTFSRTAERNPQGMERLAHRLRSIDAPTRHELVRLCYRTSERYAQRDRSPWTQPLVLARQIGLPAGAR